MHQGQGALDRGVAQVQEEAAHLGGDEHALVDDGAAGHGAHVEDAPVQRGVGVGALLDRAAADVELALELVAGRHVIGTANEGLVDGGHAGTGRVAQVVRVDGHAAPEQQRHAFGGAALLEVAARGLDAGVVLRQEQHCHAVVALVGQQVAALLGLLAEEAVRHLEQDSGSVAGVVLEALAAAVLEVHQHRQRVVDDCVGAASLEVGDRADAARVVLELRAVQAVAGGKPRADGRLLAGRQGRGVRLARLHCRGTSPIDMVGPIGSLLVLHSLWGGVAPHSHAKRAVFVRETLTLVYGTNPR